MKEQVFITAGPLKQTRIPDHILDDFIKEKIGKSDITGEPGESVIRLKKKQPGITYDELKQAVQEYLDTRFPGFYKDGVCLRYLPSHFHKRAVYLLGPIEKYRPLLKEEGGVKRPIMFSGVYFK